MKQQKIYDAMMRLQNYVEQKITVEQTRMMPLLLLSFVDLVLKENKMIRFGVQQF